MMSSSTSKRTSLSANELTPIKVLDRQGSITQQQEGQNQNTNVASLPSALKRRLSSSTTTGRRPLPISFLLGCLVTTSLLTNMYLASWIQSLPFKASPYWKYPQSSQSWMTTTTTTSTTSSLDSNEEEVSEDSLMIIHEEEQEDKNEILHIVTTRFMQNQARFVGLGQGRLKLFETFCFPSMEQQITSNYLWIILTDPNLHPSLLDPLKILLLPHPNFFLISYNDHLSSHDDYEAMVSQNKVLSGDTDLLLSRLDDTNRFLYLETRLDSDDALDRRALLDIQETAIGLLSAKTRSAAAIAEGHDHPAKEGDVEHNDDDEDGWQVICNNLHYEWRNPLITAFNQTITDPGRLRVVKESICVTPGYTLVKHRAKHSTAIPIKPRVQHHLVTREWPECGTTRNDTTTNGIDQPEIGNDKPIATITNTTSSLITTNCWMKLQMYPSALRCRTITSAGMARIETKPEKYSFFDNQTDFFWNFVTRNYALDPELTIKTSQYLQQNLQIIVFENLMGQCSQGHSCKKSSRDKLGALLNESIKFYGGNNALYDLPDHNYTAG